MRAVDLPECYVLGGDLTMTQKEIEVILARQLAEYLAVAIFIVDTSRN